MEPFNPFEKFRGLFVPNWLARRTEVSHGAKMCYGRLMQFHGHGPQCNPRESILGRELGVSERTCARFLAELKKLELIKIKRRGLGRSNSYQFLRHTWMTDFRPDKTVLSQQPASSAPDQTELSDPLVRDSVERESKEENNPCSPLKGDDKSSTVSRLFSQAEEIYAAYPSKVGKPTALRAIRRALTRHKFEFVLERTQLFAQTYTGDLRFMPHPSTFFRQERFNDDAVTWRRGTSIAGKVQPSRQFQDKDYNQPLSNL